MKNKKYDYDTNIWLVMNDIIVTWNIWLEYKKSENINILRNNVYWSMKARLPNQI